MKKTLQQMSTNKTRGLFILCFLLIAQISIAQTAYIANSTTSNVFVIDLITNTAIDTIDVGHMPLGVAISPDGNKIYVANYGANSVSVIDAFTNTV